MRNWVVVFKVRAVNLLNSVEFKMVVDLLLTTSCRGALSQLKFTSLAITKSITLKLEKYSFSF